MTTYTHNEFRIVELIRIFKSDEEEKLKFTIGVNLMEGNPNTGKTTWLQCLNYLLGAENPVEHYFTDDFTEKYRSIKGVFIVNNRTVIITRDWTVQNQKSKTFYNGEKYKSDELQKKLLSELKMPVLYYPKTDPISDIRATSLSFRMHFRHLYRQQKYWNDLVDRQPAGEFRSCLLNFLGLAEKIYTADYFEFYKISDELKTANEQYNIQKRILEIIIPIISTTFGTNLENADILFIYEKLIKANQNRLSEIRGKLVLDNKIKPNDSPEIEKFLEDYIYIIREQAMVEERIRILKCINPFTIKLTNSLKEKEKLSEKIQPYYQYIKNLGATLEVDKMLQTLCDSMDEYLTILNKIRPNTWKHGNVTMVLNRNHVNIRINYKSWNTVLGGTDALYFFLSYHYGLLSISSNPLCNVPGLIIIDLPPDIQTDGRFEDESFVVRPFTELLAKDSHSHCQVIFAGHGFTNLSNCNRIKMEKEYLG